MKIYKTRNVIGMVMIAALGIGVAGCQSTKDERSAGRTLDDEKMVDRIKESLEEEPVYKFHQVDVKAFAGALAITKPSARRKIVR